MRTRGCIGADLRDLSLAFLLLVHKNPEQVNEFVHQICQERRANVFIHVDEKCPDSIVQAIAVRPGVTVLQNRVCVTWGDFSMIDATLLLLRAARASGKNYDFVSLNSGQDLLVRAGLHEHLARNAGAIYMASRRISENDSQNNAWAVSWPKVARNIYEFPYHPFRLMRAGMRALYARGLNIRPNSLELPHGWGFYRGSQWMCLPGDVADYVLNYVDSHPDYCDLLRESLVPDEFFFTTLIMNSPHAHRAAGHNLTYLNFRQTRTERNHPIRLTIHDIAKIESSGRFFARKFDEKCDSDVIRYFRTSARSVLDA